MLELCRTPLTRIPKGNEKLFELAGVRINWSWCQILFIMLKINKVQKCYYTVHQNYKRFSCSFLLKFFSQNLFNLGDGGGTQFPYKLKFFGHEKYVEITKGTKKIRSITIDRRNYMCIIS
jgi:hypothetical protein